jgi:sodium/potassium-transporting ATPase subunit beta
LDNPDSFEGNLGHTMPDTLKAHIKKAPKKDMVWVECHGQYPADREYIGPLEYFPESQGFPVDVVYRGVLDKDGKKIEPEYEAPIVAVRFANPKKDQLLHVECRAWARNIKYDKRDRLGINLFELHILNSQISNE